MSTFGQHFEGKPSDGQQAIRFRPTALRRYRNRTDSRVALKIDSGPGSSALWPVLLILLACGIALWSQATPVYLPGSLVRINNADSHRAEEATAVLLFTKPEQLSRLRAGKHIVLVAAQKRIKGTILAIEPPSVSIGALRDKFGLSFGTTSPVSEPAAVAVIQLESSIDALDLEKARIEIGEHRPIAMLPLVGRLFAA